MPKVNSCNVKNAANPNCCPNAIDIGTGEEYIIKCKPEDRTVEGYDRFPFPDWCPLPIGERNA